MLPTHAPRQAGHDLLPGHRIVGLQLMGYAGWVSNVFYGGALVIAITVSTIARSRIIRG